MEDKRKKRSPKVSLPQPPPPPINPRKLSVLPASKSATFSLGLPQPPSPKNRSKFKRSVGTVGQQSKEVLSVPVVPPKNPRCVAVVRYKITAGDESLFIYSLAYDNTMASMEIRISQKNISAFVLCCCVGVAFVIMLAGHIRRSPEHRSLRGPVKSLSRPPCSTRS